MRHCFITIWRGGFLAVWILVLSIGGAAAANLSSFTPVRTQYVAALADPGAKNGVGAENWGLWRVDPGPRGVWLRNYQKLVAAGGIAPAQWTFNADDWWLDENGLIMEAPAFGFPAGRYVVTGDREVMTVLTVYPKDATGSQRWELDDNATIYDVTHLRCRSARYTPQIQSKACSPALAPQGDFPISEKKAMPNVQDCKKQDYTVLFIVGIEQ